MNGRDCRSATSFSLLITRLENLQLNPALGFGFVINLVGCFDKVFGLGFENVVHVLLRVAVNQRKPGALDVHHDPVPLLEGMADVLKWQINFRHLARHEWLRFFVAVAESTSNDIATKPFVGIRENQDSVGNQLRTDDHLDRHRST